MVNKVILVGRLGQDPDLKYAASGMPIANFSVATDEAYTDKEGNPVRKTEWHRIVVFQRQAENCKNYLKKGSLVYVEGSIQTRKYQDQQGQERSMTEIKATNVRFLDKKGDGQGGADGSNYGDRKNYNGGSGSHDEDMGSPFPSEASMDKVPF